MLKELKSKIGATRITIKKKSFDLHFSVPGVVESYAAILYFIVLDSELLWGLPRLRWQILDDLLHVVLALVNGCQTY